LKSRHYEWLKRALLEPLGKRDFVTLAPESAYFFPSIRFRKSDAPEDNNPPAGENRVTVSYRSSENGSSAGVKGVWTGTVAANTVTFVAK
jgi:hypothetical protein